MRRFMSVAFLALFTAVSAIPITPAAPELQRRVEQFRLHGLDEHEIAARLALESEAAESQPLFSRLSTKMHSLFHHCTEEEEEDDGDLSGDIAPGSLEAPQMLPRPASIDGETLSNKIIALLRREDAEQKRFAYEGKELELRRPTGMRHWGAEDKWRLF